MGSTHIDHLGFKRKPEAKLNLLGKKLKRVELLSKLLKGEGEMAQQVKVTTTKCGDLGSIPETYIVEGKMDSPSCPLTSTCVLSQGCTYAHLRTLTYANK